MKKIVLSKFRLGDKSERVAALADEWGCSVTVAVGRLLAAGLAAVDRDQRMTPDAIRAGFGELDRLSIDDWVAQKSTPDAVSRDFICSEMTMEAIEAAECLMPSKLWLPGLGEANDAVDELLGEWTPIEPVGGQLKPWPIPDSPGKRMFDEAARHAFENEYSGKFETRELTTPEEVQAAILNGYPVRSVPSEFWGGSPTEADQNHAMAMLGGRRPDTFPSPACGGWGNSGLGLPTIEEIDALESLRDASKVLERIKYLDEFGAPINDQSWPVAPSAVGWPGSDDELCADEACPGCGCLPGDGVTDGCTHPDGCGYYEDQDPRSMGWVGDDGRP